MSAKIRITGGSNNEVADLHGHEEKPRGLVVYDTPLDHFNYSVQYLTNGTFGRDMNVDATAATVTTTPIYDGTDTAAWTASAVTGGGFDFLSTAVVQSGTYSVDATVSANNDIAGFTAPAPVNPASYTYFRAGIYFTGFEQSGTKDVTFQLFLNGAAVSAELSVKPYVDTTSLNDWLLLDIPMSDFQTSSPEFDELRIKTVDSGRGAAPDYYLDNMVLISAANSTGTIDFAFYPEYEDKYYVNTLRMSALTTGKTNLDSSEFFGLTALTNGIELILRDKTRVIAALDAKDTFDMISWGDVTVTVEGSTNNVTTVIDFHIPERHMVLDGSKGQFIVLRVRDNLSTLTRLRTSVNLSQFVQH